MKRSFLTIGWSLKKTCTGSRGGIRPKFAGQSVTRKEVWKKSIRENRGGQRDPKRGFSGRELTSSGGVLEGADLYLKKKKKKSGRETKTRNDVGGTSD